MFAGNVMECDSFYTEYYNGVLEDGASPCEEGQIWLNTYAVRRSLCSAAKSAPNIRLQTAGAGFCSRTRLRFLPVVALG